MTHIDLRADAPAEEVMLTARETFQQPRCNGCGWTSGLTLNTTDWC